MSEAYNHYTFGISWSPIRIEKLGIIAAALAIFLHVLSLRWDLHTPIYLRLAFLFAYPISNTISRRTTSYRSIWILLFALFFGSLFSISSPVPIGYADAQKHLNHAQHLSSIPISSYSAGVSKSWVTLYVYSFVLESLFSTTLPTVARVLPTILFITTSYIFLFLISKNFLNDNHLIATALFATNWGVLRFIIEYRTLIISLPLLLIALFSIICISDGEARGILVFTITVLVLSISHFATLILGGIFVAPFILLTIPRCYIKRIFISLILVFPFLFLYLEYLLSSFGVLTSSLLGVALSILNISSGPGAGTQGLVGLTYGYNLFIIQWVTRVAFVFSGMYYTIFSLYQRDKLNLSLVIGSGLLSPLIFLAVGVSFVLTPSRILTFLSIPYSIIFVSVLNSTGGRNDSRFLNHRVGKLAKIILLIAIVLALSMNYYKFPQSIVGETEPIRTQAPIDELDSLQIGAEAISLQGFSRSYIPCSISDVRLDKGAENFFVDGISKSSRSCGSKYQIMQDQTTSRNIAFDSGTYILSM